MLISCQRAVTALSVNPVMPHHIAIGCSDSTVRIFDRRTLSTSATGKFYIFKYMKYNSMLYNMVQSHSMDILQIGKTRKN